MAILVSETKLMAHLPLAFVDDPREMLIIAFGMGTTAKSALTHENLNVTTVELVPEVYQVFPFFHEEAEEIMRNPRFTPIVNDGRNHLLLNEKKYDVISIDPAPPIWSAGTVNLYTREFFQLCKRRLTEKGIMFLWFPGSDSESDLFAIAKSFQDVFPNTHIFSGPRGWGFCILGFPEGEKPEKKDIQKLFRNKQVFADMTEYDDALSTPEKLFRFYLADADRVRHRTAKYPMVTDNNPYTEFPLFRYFLFNKDNYTKIKLQFD